MDSIPHTMSTISSDYYTYIFISKFDSFKPDFTIIGNHIHHIVMYLSGNWILHNHYKMILINMIYPSHASFCILNIWYVFMKNKTLTIKTESLFGLYLFYFLNVLPFPWYDALPLVWAPWNEQIYREAQRNLPWEILAIQHHLLPRPSRYVAHL